MTTIIAPDVQRFNFERIVGELSQQKGISVDTVKTGYKHMPHVLRIGQYLNPTSSSYTFTVRKGVDTPIPGEIKLDQQDAFAVTGIGLRFSKADFASGAYSNHGNFPHLTFPDPSYFVGAPASGTTKKEWEALQTLLNGVLQVNVGGDVVVDGLVASLLAYNPPATYTSSPVALPQLGGSIEEHGVYQLTPQYILDAAQDNSFVLNLASGATDRTLIDGNLNAAGSAATTRNIVWLYLFGFKVKNLSSQPSLTANCRPV